MGKLTVTRGQGGLNRPLPGTDHISSLVFYSDILPAGFTANDRIKRVVDIEGAEALGINDDAATDILIKIMHYHISEFFRMAPGATLYIAIYAEPVGVHTFADLTTVINFANGEIKQMGVWTKKTFITGDVTTLQGIMTDAETANKPLISLLQGNIAALTAATLPDLRILTAPNVGVIAGQDGANVGAALYTTATYSVGVIGAALGVLAVSKVNESIGWVEKYPLNDGTNELDVPALANGSLMVTLTDAVIDQMDLRGWLQLNKYGTALTYFYGSPAAVALISDYAYLELSRTMNKAQRNVRARLLPAVNGPVLVDPISGKLDPDTITHLENQGDKGLEDMDKAGEISGYKTVINPDQNVNATGILEVVIKSVPVGVSRSINVKLGFTTSL